MSLSKERIHVLPKELQELHDIRAKLEDESQSLKEEQKKKEETVKALEEKIIEELNNKNEKARQSISQLNSKIGDLERRLEQIGQEPDKQYLGLAEVNTQINDKILSKELVKLILTSIVSSC